MSALVRGVGSHARWTEAERVKALKRIVSSATIRSVLRRTGRDKTYCRRLTREFTVWFVIAMSLFCRDSYRQVFRWLCRFRRGGTPGRSTLCEARRSVGAAPLRWLAERVIQLQGQPHMPQVFYRGFRLMAMDSFVVDLPDTERNTRTFGRPGSKRSPSAFPQARVMSLCECGTHVLWRSLIKPRNRSESVMARYFLRFLRKNMLLLWDRGFFSYGLLEEVRRRKVPVLARLKKHMVLQPVRRLPDGSYLAKVYRASWYRAQDSQGILTRIIEYTFDDPGRPGSGQKHRLLTTFLNAGEHPAQDLITLYHERWEEELAIDELKTHQQERPVLRSETPAGVVQEIYGLLIGHYVIRKLMCEAAATIDVAPRRISFVNTLKILRCRLPECNPTPCELRRWHANLIAEIAENVLEPRRNRINPRVIKRKMSRWLKKRPKHRNSPQPTRDFRQSIVLLI
jgi:hypothetical protein